MIEYEIIPEKRQVTATMLNCEVDLAQLLVKCSQGLIKPKNALPSTFTATVVCSDTDTFDAEAGKKLARKRVLDKHNKCMANLIAAEAVDAIKALNACVAAASRIGYTLSYQTEEEQCQVQAQDKKIVSKKY